LRFAQSNAWLNDLDKEFQNLKESGRPRIRGKELVEDDFIVLKGLFKRQVVEPFSGARYFGEPFKVPKSDHFSIAKPAGPQAVQHRLLERFIADMREVNPARRVPRSSPPPAPAPAVAVTEASTVPQLTLDWPYSEVDDRDLRAFLAEAHYRAEHGQEPWFHLSLTPLAEARETLAAIDANPAPTSVDRIKRVETLRFMEYLESKDRGLGQCLRFILSEQARRQVGWGLASEDNRALVATELLSEPSKEGRVRVLMINDRAQLTARLYMDRLAVEANFKCSLSHSDSFLSILDCLTPIDVSEADWETIWRSLAAILRTLLERGIDPTDSTAVSMINWRLSPD
jgi:hypothetical protein